MARHLKSDVDVDFMAKEAESAAQQVLPDARVLFERLPNHGAFKVRVAVRVEHSLAMPLAAILSDPDLPAKLSRQAALAVREGLQERLDVHV